MYSALNKLKTFLDTYLSDAVSKFETDNGVSLTPLSVLKIFTEKGNQYPQLIILPDETEPMSESAGNRVYFGNPNKRNEIITIQVWDRGNTNNADTIETNVIGYMDSLEELFKSDYTIEGVKGVEILGTRYTDLFPDISSGSSEGMTTLLLKGASIQIKIKYNIL